MTRDTLQLNAAVVGLALAAAATLSAQVPTPIDVTPTPAASSSTPRVTGAIVDLRNTSPTPTAETSELLQFSRLLNANIQASDGSFGRVADVVFDRNGNIQYLLGSSQGQTFVLPYLPGAISTTGNALTFNVPITTLQQLAINPQNLPPMQSLAFLTRMRQVFGPTFGTSQFVSANPPPTNQTGIGVTPSQPGISATPSIGGISATPSQPGISASPRIGGISATPRIGGASVTPGVGTVGTTATLGSAIAKSPNTTAGAATIGSTAGATTLGNSWNWPTMAAPTVPGTRNGRFISPGAATGRNSGTGVPSVRPAPGATGGGSTSGAGRAGSK